MDPLLLRNSRWQLNRGMAHDRMAHGSSRFYGTCRRGRSWRSLDGWWSKGRLRNWRECLVQPALHVLVSWNMKSCDSWLHGRRGVLRYWRRWRGRLVVDNGRHNTFFEFLYFCCVMMNSFVISCANPYIRGLSVVKRCK